MADNPTKQCAVYCFTNTVNGKQYVGQARNLRQRIRDHRNAANGHAEQSYSDRTAIARAMRKYGFDKFELAILETCEAERLNEREVYWIATLKTMVPDGYNLTAGGNNGKRVVDVGRRISRMNKGREKGPEWRAALSASRKGFKMSAEQRQKISDIQRGRKQSAESNAKRSAALKGRELGPYSAERRAAISAGMSKEGHLRSIAASVTPEVIARRSEKARGQKRTPEQCERIRAGVLASLARRRGMTDNG